MKKIFGTLVVACAILAASNAIADSDKSSSGRDGVQCIAGGESVCGIAWEGKGLFEIRTRAETGGAVTMDLQMAYTCCTEDKTRRAICDKKVTSAGLFVAEYCYDYLLNFFNPDAEQVFALLDLREGSAHSSRTVWTEKVGKLTDDIVRSNPDSAVAVRMKECKDDMNSNSTQAARFVLDKLTGTNLDESERCISAIFDTLRDKTTCLWNNADGALCDE